MKISTKKLLLSSFISLLGFNLFSLPFNSKISSDELKQLNNGEVIIRNIGNAKNICLNKNINEQTDELLKEVTDFGPKYLAEIIQIKPYKGNENLPEVLSQLLCNVSDYAGIPYYSVRNDKWYDLYDSAEIQEEKIITKTASLTSKELKALFVRQPFGKIYETINLKQTDSYVYYSSINTNKLRYKDEFDCVGAKKLKICILLFGGTNQTITKEQVDRVID